MAEPNQEPKSACYPAYDGYCAPTSARAGNGWWQAIIPEPDGEIVTTRYTLRALVDKLDAGSLFLDAALRVLVR